MTTEQIRELHDIHDKLGEVIGELESKVDSTPVEEYLDSGSRVEVEGINSMVIGRSKPLPKSKHRRGRRRRQA